MMPKRTDRRDFLRTATSAVIAGPQLTRAARTWTPTARAEPGRIEAPRLLTGCCAYSYRKLLGAGKITMEDVIRRAVDLGIDGVDMTGYWFKSTDSSYLASLRHLAFKQGVCFSGAAIGASTLKSAREYACKKGATLGIEDHERMTQNADACLEIVYRVDSPFFGINLDITNFIPTAKADACAQIEATVPYATHSHIRDRFENGQAGDLDRVWKIFAGSNYKGFMSAEYEGEEDPCTGVPKLVDRIKTLSRKYSSV